jgi:hypothetical protein
MATKNDEIEAVTRAWEEALANHDADALLACYATDATLESPVAAHVLGGRGVVEVVEVMEIENGLIQSHRVYWGWRGVEILNKDQYHRD